MGDIYKFDIETVVSMIAPFRNENTRILICAGPPCPDFSRIRKQAPGLVGPNGQLFAQFLQIVHQVDNAFGQQNVDLVVENVYFQDMSETAIIDNELHASHVICDSADAGLIKRVRLWWTRHDWSTSETNWEWMHACPQVRLPDEWKQDHSKILEEDHHFHPHITEGWRLLETFTTPAETDDGRPPPAGRRHAPEVMARWQQDGCTFAPWHYKDHNLVYSDQGHRLLDINEKERCHGLPTDWTALEPSPPQYQRDRHRMLGNSWHILPALYIIANVMHCTYPNIEPHKLPPLTFCQEMPKQVRSSKLQWICNRWLASTHTVHHVPKQTQFACDPECRHIATHLDLALKSDDPRRTIPPTFGPVQFAIDLLCELGPDIVALRSDILSEIESLAFELEEETASWWSTRPLHVQKAYRQFVPSDNDIETTCTQIPLLKHLLALFAYPDQEQLFDELDNGFFVMGALPPGAGWNARKDNKYQKPISRERFQHENLTYVRNKLRNPRLDYAEKMLDEVLAETKLGRIEGPFEAPPSWNTVTTGVPSLPTTIRTRECPTTTPATALAFPILQTGSDDQTKVRRGEDWRRSHHNETVFATDAPHHDSIESFVNLARTMNRHGLKDLRLWGHDHEGAYRQLPLRHPDEAYLLLHTKRGPTLWRHNVLLFGAVGSVWAYNRLGDVLTFISSVIMAIPTLHYVDDYGGIEPETTAQSAFTIFEDVNKTQRFHVKQTKKQAPATKHKVQGVNIEITADGVILSPTPNRLETMTKAIERCLEEESLEPPEAARLAGKLSFLTSTLFGKVGRGHLQAIYARQHCDPRESWSLGTRLKASLGALVELLPIMRPKFIPFEHESKPPVIFGDAFWTPTERGRNFPMTGDRNGWGIIFFPRRPDWPHAFGCHGEVPIEVLLAFDTNKAQIFLLEALTAILSGCIAPVFSNSHYITFIDNEPAKFSLLNGHTKNHQVNNLVSAFWHEQARANTMPWFERVTSEANCSDAISRGDPTLLHENGWPILSLNLKLFWKLLIQQDWDPRSWAKCTDDLKDQLLRWRDKHH